MIAPDGSSGPSSGMTLSETATHLDQDHPTEDASTRGGSTQDGVTPMAYRAPTRNREAERDYDIVWPWQRGQVADGMSAVLRVKNEAASLPFTLPGLFDSALREVIIVDNGSTDDTLAVARAVAEQRGADDRLRTYTYPFSVARCGSEHLATPPDSVRSLPYFYNWAFSHVRTRYALKWDGDMVLTSDGKERLDKQIARLSQGSNCVLTAYIHPVYVHSDQLAWIDLGFRHRESYGYKIDENFVHMKAFDWELPVWGTEPRKVKIRPGSCLELKWLDADEFAHWTGVEDFEASTRSSRKQREWSIYTALREGRTPPVDGVVRVEAPHGVHVIDYISATWLGQAPRPLREWATHNHPGSNTPR